MKEIKPTEIPGNAIELIGTDWMLVTSGDKESFNTMTASWGMLGEMWGLPVAETVVRPQRYTFGFIEKTGKYTLSFFRKDMKKVLGVMGTKSGREIDKMHYPGLTAMELPSGQMSFEEAWLVIECEVIYADRFVPEAFLDKELIEKWYDSDFHKRFIGRITHAWIKEGQSALP
ncbi:MAG: flavin reductase [Bacteroidales bacterium]|nr:flavin reductase [Bacteroidales bacterium]